MKTQLEKAKTAVIVELENLGYSEKERKQFKETTKCPRCGFDFSIFPYSGRWLAHFVNCQGKQSKPKR